MNHNCNTTTAPRLLPALPAPFVSTGATVTMGTTPGLLTRALSTLELWHHRSNERARLARLDGELLADIGVTAEQIDRETSKFFWQA